MSRIANSVYWWMPVARLIAIGGLCIGTNRYVPTLSFTMASDEEDVPDRKLFLLGRNYAKIPCFRNTFLTAIPTGFACGIGYFLFTSNVRHAMHVTIGTFTCTALGYWVHCRYKWSKQRFEMMRLKEAMKRKALYEGTAEDPTLIKNAKDA